MRQTRWWMRSFLMFCFASVILCFNRQLLWAQEKPLPVNVSIGSLVVGLAPYVIAREKGYFRQEGIEPRFILMQSSVASKAIVTKDIEINTLGSPTINSAIAGLPIRGIFANGNRTNMYLVGSKEIGSLEDLKGKRIGIGGFGDLAQVGAIRFLRANRVDPKEVTFILVGGGQSSGRLAAVLSGAIAATPLSPPYDYLAKKAGLKILGYFGDIFPSYYASLGVHLDTFQTKRRMVKGFVKASLKGLRFMHAHKAETVEIMLPFMKTNDRDMVGATYDSNMSAHTKNGILTPEAQHEIIAIAMEGMKRTGEIRPEAVFDFSLAKEAEQELDAERWKP
jgi:ABC-type nitrate/sulfonate/bicarbonate transport system substrate-binding protein